jgi:SNF2 family DNA or RNA helicase
MSELLILRNYQTEAVAWMYNTPASGLFADPGLGKTACVLTILKILKSRGEFRRALIVAPLRVATITWPDEIALWKQFCHMTFHVLHGKEKNIKTETDIHLINPEGLFWLWKQKMKPWPYDVLIIDESTKFKNHKAKRTKSMFAHSKKFKRRHLLTGTPAPRSLLNLFPQMKILDGGKSLGKHVGAFRDKYFVPSGYKNYDWKIKDGASEKIYEKIAPSVMRLDAKDHLDIPDILYNTIKVDLGPKAYKAYKTMEKKLFAELDECIVVAPSKASAYGKCRQICNGFAYKKNEKPKALPIPYSVHEEKVNAVLDFIDELQGKPVFIVYWYKFDYEMLTKALGRVPTLNGSTSVKQSNKYIKMWNNDEIPVMLAQPVSCSHGLNMQKGSGLDIVWYSIPDDLEIYTQLNDRIHRSGVKGRVRVHHVIARKTIDEVLVSRLKLKADTQDSLLLALKEWRGTNFRQRE